MCRILAFGCHPDDVEFMCAGTLALLAEQGCEIHIAVMAGGEAGSVELCPSEIRAKRLKEAQQAADVIGAEFHYAGGCDLEVEYNSHYRKLATAVIRKVQPDIVLTNPPVDYLADHEMTSLLVRNACFIAPVVNYDCGSNEDPMKKIPTLYYWSPIEQIDNFGNPTQFHFGVDISRVLKTKTKMLQCHQSQREWLRYINGWDEYTDKMIGESQRMGDMFGVEFAEGFVQHLGNGYPKENTIEKFLGLESITKGVIN